MHGPNSVASGAGLAAPGGSDPAGFNSGVGGSRQVVQDIVYRLFFEGERDAGFPWRGMLWVVFYLLEPLHGCRLMWSDMQGVAVVTTEKWQLRLLANTRQHTTLSSSLLSVCQFWHKQNSQRLERFARVSTAHCIPPVYSCIQTTFHQPPFIVRRFCHCMRGDLLTILPRYVSRRSVFVRFGYPKGSLDLLVSDPLFSPTSSVLSIMCVFPGLTRCVAVLRRHQRTPPTKAPAPTPSMADQEEDYSSLPLTERFTHKVIDMRGGVEIGLTGADLESSERRLRRCRKTIRGDAR
jgi:hypothetical protein